MGRTWPRAVPPGFGGCLAPSLACALLVGTSGAAGVPGHGGGAAAACVGAVFLKSLAYLPAPTAAIGPPAKAPSGAAPRLTHPADDSCALTATGASLRGPAPGGGSGSRAGAGSTNPHRAQSPPAALPQRPRAARPPLQRFPPSGAVQLGFASSWPAACHGAAITAAFFAPQLCLEVPVLIPRLPPGRAGWERSSRMRRWPPACCTPLRPPACGEGQGWGSETVPGAPFPNQASPGARGSCGQGRGAGGRGAARAPQGMGTGTGMRCPVTGLGLGLPQSREHRSPVGSSPVASSSPSWCPVVLRSTAWGCALCRAQAPPGSFPWSCRSGC